MERRDYLIAASLLIVSTSVFFGTGSLVFQEQSPEKYSEMFNVTVDSDNSVNSVNFDNRSLQLMFESGERARMYIDRDMDGSFDVELTDLERNGDTNTFTSLITYDSTSYRLHFKYSDNSSVEGDAFLNLYQIQEL